jgi:Protein of unknown function (DUF3102)
VSRSIESKELTALAELIGKTFDQMRIAARTSVERAMEIGDLLITARDHPGMKHGMWESWLKKNCAMSAGTARRYIELAEARSDIEAKLKSANLSVLTMGAAKALTKMSEGPGGRSEARAQVKVLHAPSSSKTSLNSLAWSEATRDQRRHFLEAIGAASLVEALSAECRIRLALELQRIHNNKPPTIELQTNSGTSPEIAGTWSTPANRNGANAETLTP